MIALMFLGAVGLYVVMGGFIVKRVPNKWGKGIAIAILILIPTGDSLVGHLYFSYLCSTEAGIKVYQPIELSAEYWTANGKPNFYDETNGNLRLPLDRLEWISRTEIYPLSVEKDISEMKDRTSGRILNERILFMYWGGWLSRNFSPHNSAVSCNSDVKAYTNYIRQIFVPVRSSK